MKMIVQTDKAPEAIGSYSQAIRVGQTVYLSGQIPLDPKTKNLVTGDMRSQILQVIENLRSVAKASGGSLDQIIKLSVYLVDIQHLALVNEMMLECFQKPFPARTSIQVAALPKGAQVEMDAILSLEA